MSSKVGEVLRRNADEPLHGSAFVGEMGRRDMWLVAAVSIVMCADGAEHVDDDEVMVSCFA